MRYMITDELWTTMGPCVEQAKRYKCGRAPVLPERMFFEAVLYIARTGIPWRDLPSEFGAWDAVYNRFRRWIASGSLARLFELLTDNPEFGDVKRMLIDASNVRAQSVCGRRTKKKGSAADQGLGRSRGGFTSKIVLTAADEDTAIAVDVVPGQTHEASHLETMIDATTARVPDIEEGVADKGFDGEPQRQAFRDRNIKPVIPYKTNCTKPGRLNKKAYCKRKHDRASYRQTERVPPCRHAL